MTTKTLNNKSYYTKNNVKGEVLEYFRNNYQ